MNDARLLEDAWEETQLVPEDAITLSEPQISQAQEWAMMASGEPQQWRVFQLGLALAGFQQWLQDRGLETPLNLDHCSLNDPVTATLIDAIAQLKLGSLRVCLLTRSQMEVDRLTIPATVVHLEQFCPDLWIWVEANEELGWVKVLGGCGHSDLSAHLVGQSLKDWSYEIPIDSTLDSPANLLLALRCLPAEVLQEQWSLADRRASSLPSFDPVPLSARELHQRMASWTDMSDVQKILTLEQGLAILDSTHLSQAWAQMLEALPASPQNTSHFSVQQWWNRLSASFEIGWTAVPPLSPAMRSGESEATIILEQLEQQGIVIDPAAQCHVQDLSIQDQRVRLYACVERLETAEPEWSLLLVLCSTVEIPLSKSLRLNIRDQDELLATTQLHPNTSKDCVYVQVLGSLDEKFWVSIALEEDPQTAITLPPLGPGPE